jgi:hypothetical protein
MLNAIINPTKTLAVLCALLIACFNTSLYAAVGKVEFTTAGAYATNAGQQRILAKGMEINQGDTIITEAGRTQIRFSDGGYISLQPNTEFKVDEYSYDGKTDGSEKGFFSLVKGGLRAITGAVGRVNKTAYRVNTPVATIGIRGTEFLAQFDGRLLVKVGDGAVYMTNASGDLILFKGQVGEVKDSNTKPNYTNDETTMNAGGPKGATPNQVNTENQQQQQQSNTFTVAEQYNEDGTSCVVTGSCPVVKSAGPQGVKLENQGYAFAGDITSSSASSTTNESFNSTGAPVSVSLDGQGNLVALSDGASTITFTGNYFDKGSSGPLSWQRINNASLTDGNELATYGNLHFVFGSLTPESDLMNLASTFNQGYYTAVGGTNPTDKFGNIGSLNYATLFVDFGEYYVTTEVGLTIQGATYTAFGDGGFSSQGSPIFYTNGGTNVEGNYSASGFLSGSNASHAAFSYTLNDSITGAVALGKSTIPTFVDCSLCVQ